MTVAGASHWVNEKTWEAHIFLLALFFDWAYVPPPGNKCNRQREQLSS